MCPLGGRAGPAAATGSSWQTAGFPRAVMDVFDEFGVTQLMPCPNTAYVGSRCPRSKTPAVKRVPDACGWGRRRRARPCHRERRRRRVGTGGHLHVIALSEAVIVWKPVGGHAGLQSRTGHFCPGGRIPAGAALIGSGQARRGTHTHTPARDTASAGARRGQDLIFG